MRIVIIIKIIILEHFMNITTRNTPIILASVLSLFYLGQSAVFASGVMSKDELSNVERVEAKSEEDKKRLSEAAGLLAQYGVL